MQNSILFKNSFISFLISILISLYIFFTFLSWAVTSQPYDIYIIFFSIIIIFYFLAKIKYLIKSKNNLIYLFILLTYLIIIFTTLLNSPNSIKINTICEHTIWMLSPILLLELSSNKFPLKIIISSFLFINFIFGLGTFILFYFNEIKHIYDLPVATVSGPFLRVAGYYNEHNANGLTNLIALCSSVWLITNSKKIFPKLILIIPICLSIFLIIASGSRAALLAIAVAVAYTLIAFCPKKLRILVAILGVICIIFAIPFIIDFRDASLVENIASKDSLESIINSLSSGRYTIWKEAILMGNQHPFIGHGLGTMAKNALSTFGESSVIYQLYLQDAHNTYINTYYNSGIFCTITFSLLVLSTLFLLLFDKKMNQLSAKNIFLCFVILSFLDLVILYTITLFNIFFWIFLVYIWKYRKTNFLYIKGL